MQVKLPGEKAVDSMTGEDGRYDALQMENKADEPTVLASLGSLTVTESPTIRFSSDLASLKLDIPACPAR